MNAAGYQFLKLGVQALQTNLKHMGDFKAPLASEDQAAHVDAAGLAHVKWRA